MYNYPNKKPQFSPWDHLNGPIIVDVARAEVARLSPYTRHLHEPPTPTGNDVEAIFCPPGGPPFHSLSNYCPSPLLSPRFHFAATFCIGPRCSSQIWRILPSRCEVTLGVAVKAPLDPFVFNLIVSFFKKIEVVL